MCFVLYYIICMFKKLFVIGIIILGTVAIGHSVLAIISSGDLCSKNFEQPLDSLCQNDLSCLEKCKILRDTKRQMDLSQVKSALEGWKDSFGKYYRGYKDDYGKYPIFESGTYEKYITLSNWPSWQAIGSSLNNLLKPYLSFLATDPIQPAGLQSLEEYKAKPTCPIYKYESLNNGQGYKLFYLLERLGQNFCNLTYFTGTPTIPLESNFQFSIFEAQSKTVEQGGSALYQAKIISQYNFNQPIFFEIVSSTPIIIGAIVEPNVASSILGISPPPNQEINFELRVKTATTTIAQNYQLEIKAKTKDGKIVHLAESKINLKVEEMPTSNVLPLNAYQATSSFLVAWQEEITGSGIKYFNVQYKDKIDNQWKDFATTMLETNRNFNNAIDGHTYCFQSQVESNIDNLEPYPGGDGDTCVLVDLTAPVTTDNIQDKWLNQNFEVVFSANDTGSGIDKIYYTINGSEPNENSSIANNGKFTLDQDGEYTIKYFSKDKAGNKEAVKTAINKVKIDKTAPTVNITAPTNGQQIKNQNNLNISVEALDNLSGIEKIEIFNGDNKLGQGNSFNWNIQNLADGKYTIKAKVYDNAGNVKETSIEVTINYCGNNQVGETEVCDSLMGLANYDCTENGILSCKNDCSVRICSVGNLYQGTCGNSIIENPETCDSQIGLEEYQCIGGGQLQCNDCKRQCTENGMLAQCGSGNAKLYGEVSDTMSLNKISGALIEVKDSKDKVIKSFTTGVDGKYNFENLTKNFGELLCGYKITVTKNGYQSGQADLFGFDKNTEKNFGLTREGLRAGTKIKIEWTNGPKDLDAHLLIGTQDIYYYNMGCSCGTCTGVPIDGASLDIDNCTIAGVETITINPFFARYTYKYFVKNYQGGTFSNTSLPIVTIISDGEEIFRFNCPKAFSLSISNSLTSGAAWHVFNIDGNTGQVTPINAIVNE